MKKEIEIHPDADALVYAAAGRVATLLESTLRQKEIATFVLTGGKTPAPIYELLGSPPLAERIDWNRIQFFWGDERCVPPDSPDSNFGMAWKAFVSKLGAPSSHIHRMLGELDDPDKAAWLYEQELRKVFPETGIPSFDLLLLGMGTDGHVASLFPGTSWNESRLVVSNYLPETGANRISMTFRILNQAQATLIIVAGSDKAKALSRVIQDPACDLPAAKIQPALGSLRWMVDAPAATLIRD
jgi:6-phosphogluconolactonase